MRPYVYVAHAAINVSSAAPPLYTVYFRLLGLCAADCSAATRTRVHMSCTKAERGRTHIIVWLVRRSDTVYEPSERRSCSRQIAPFPSVRLCAAAAAT